MKGERRIVWLGPLAGLWVVVACALAALVTWVAAEPEAVETFMGESGPVERLTAASYILCAIAVWLARWHDGDWRGSLALSMVMLGFAMRELDWHKAFSGTSVLRLSWYAGPALLPAKLLAASAVLAVGAALLWLVWRYAPRIGPAFRRREPVAVTVIVFVLTLVLAKSLDRSVGILVDDFGVHVPMRWIALRSAFEEWLELSLAFLVLLGLVQHRLRHR